MKYIITLGLLFPLVLFSQEQYSYSFAGEMDSIFIEELSLQIAKVDGVSEAKGRYKVEKKMGEIYIYTTENRSKGEGNQNTFNAAHVKAIFIKNKLTPLDIIKLN